MDFDWQAEYEKAGEAEYAYYSLATDEQLLAELDKRTFGRYYSLWDVIRYRKKPNFIQPLFEALKTLRGLEYFHDRHHCIDAIFELAGIKNKPLRARILGYSTEFNETQFETALQELEKKIRRKLAQIH